jgi:hypothetical protein
MNFHSRYLNNLYLKPEVGIMVVTPLNAIPIAIHIHESSVHMPEIPP